MNFVIFPMFFIAPLCFFRSGSSRRRGRFPLLACVRCNPFTHAMELIRFSVYGQSARTALWVVIGTTLVVRSCWRRSPTIRSAAGLRPRGRAASRQLRHLNAEARRCWIRGVVRRHIDGRGAGCRAYCVRGRSRGWELSALKRVPAMALAGAAMLALAPLAATPAEDAVPPTGGSRPRGGCRCRREPVTSGGLETR